MRYIPDGIKFKNLKREFLLSVIYEVDKEAYKNLVKIKDEQEEARHASKLKDLYVDVLQEYKEFVAGAPEVKSYEAKQNRNFIRTKKNKNPIKLVKKRKKGLVNVSKNLASTNTNSTPGEDFLIEEC